MKVAIVTLYGEFNYGNRLQNYAVQKCLENMGIQSETIVAINQVSVIDKIKKIAEKCMMALPFIVSKRKLNMIRQANFTYFTKANIPTRYIVSDDGFIPKYISDEYDKFVIGSDQVWNPCFGGYEKQYRDMFLLFTEKEKKICFSPSIGVSEIPNEWLEIFSKGFKTFPLISVRENAGANIVESCTGHRPDVLIDPTMMISSQEWLRVAMPIANINEKYILEYFLGELSPKEEGKLETFVHSEGLKRIRLLDKANPTIFTSGPSQFISLVEKAKIIYTDSYHACVFSILFGRPFVIRRRKDLNKDMYSRIDSLLQLFNIKGECSIENPYYVDEEARDKILDIEKEKVYLHIKKAMKQGGN